MWVGHFGAYVPNTGGRGVSFCNPLELSENSKLDLFQTKFVEEEVEELEEKCWS